MEEKNKKTKQHQLAVALQVSTVVLAGASALMYSCFHSFMMAIPYLTSDEVWNLIGGEMQQAPLTNAVWTGLMKGQLPFSLLVFVLVISFLNFFRRICMEIGNDNSFSLENVKNFNVMTGISAVIAVSYLIRIGVFVSRCLVASYPRAAFIIGVVYGLLALGFITLGFMCRTLARLVYNAYEMKNENDLTI